MNVDRREVFVLAYILVMEDEKIIQTIIKRFLEREGHEVVIAGDGEEGIRLYKERPADLVLTDIIMPKKEGIETIRELKKISPGVKIIAMSGGGRIDSEDYLDLAEKFGVKATFTKGSDWSMLASLVENILSED